jgi:hypothetical protein
VLQKKLNKYELVQDENSSSSKREQHSEIPDSNSIECITEKQRAGKLEIEIQK